MRRPRGFTRGLCANPDCSAFLDSTGYPYRRRSGGENVLLCSACHAFFVKRPNDAYFVPIRKETSSEYQ